MKIKPQIKFEITALNQEELFNKLKNNKIEVFDIKRKSYNNTEFKIKTNNFNNCKNILEKNNIEIVNKKTIGLVNLKKIFLARIGIFIGLFLSIILFIISNFFILNVNIIGIEKLNKSDIYSFLSSQNITTFSYKSDIDCNELELKLIDNFYEISMVSVAIKGNSLILNIKEKTTEEYLNKNFENLVSTFDGRITSFELISGTPIIKVNDIVKRGDVLVKAECLDSSNNIQRIEAKAKITAEIWSEYRYTLYDKEIKKEYTGNEIKTRQVEIFGINIFNNFADNTFSKYEQEESCVQLTIVILPIKIKQVCFKEIEEVEVINNFEEQKTTLLNLCKENALQKLEKSDIIVNEKFTVNRGEGQTNICYVITANREIF